ncbi:type II secretion system F family protein [Candidatus Dependentiae bacterium]|nr:type II secretion system F family protein [Candidatus Dependentiae bacterium]
MALYYYQALSKEGRRVTGTIDASTVQNAREQITRMGLFITGIDLVATGVRQPWYRTLFTRGVSLKDKIFFTKQLAVLLRAGVPLLQSLELLIEQTEGPLKNIIITLKDGIKEGRSLAEGLARYPETFDSIYIQLVRAGEATGKLEAILERLDDFLERRDEIRKKVTGALRYPLFQAIIIVLVTVGLLTFVIPQIATVFQGQNISLPLPTRILLSSSNFILNHYILLFMILGGLIGAFFLWRSTPQGAYMIDRLKLKLPLIGYFSRTGAIVQFCSTLGMLIAGGVNLAEALSIVVKIVDNKVLLAALEKARENIIKQGRIAQYLQETKLFPPVAIYLINTGEQSGQLDTMLLTVSSYYERDLNEKADGLTALLGPLMLVIMFVIVGFVIAGVMLPVQNLTNMAEKLQ